MLLEIHSKPLSAKMIKRRQTPIFKNALIDIDYYRRLRQARRQCRNSDMAENTQQKFDRIIRASLQTCKYRDSSYYRTFHGSDFLAS